MGILERSRRRTLLVLALIIVGVALGAFAVRSWLHAGRGGPRADRPIPGEPDRIVVEVLNATSVAGLARAATDRLRDGGIDVVTFASDTGAALDSTQVLVRRGPAAAGERVARGLGVGAPRAAPDPGRLVDVTVRLGRDFGAHARPRDP